MGQEIAPYRHRHDGLTPDKQVAFLERLEETGSVTAAALAVGVSTTSAYRVYRRVPGFARDWDEALATRRPMLEEAAFERALHGVTVPLTRLGQVVGERRRYSDGLLRYLLDRGDRLAAARAGAQQVLEEMPTSEELTASIMRKLKPLARVQRLTDWRDAVLITGRLRGEGMTEEEMLAGPPADWRPEPEDGPVVER